MLTIFRNIFAPPRHLILIVLAAWIGITLSEKRIDRYAISKDDLNNLTFYSLIAYIIGGRLAYIFENIPAFTKSPISIISINPDMFDPMGAAAIAIIFGLIYGQRHKLSLWPTLDSMTLFFATLAVGFGLSHLAAGTAFGKPTNLPWGINLWNAKRHPTQIYETIASLLTLGLLWFKKSESYPGIFFVTFVTLNAASQLFLQAFRGDSTFIAGGFKQAQVIAWVTLAICFLGFEFLLQSTKKKNG